MKKLTLWGVLVLALAACGGSSESNTPAPSAPEMFAGEVEIVYPPNGTVIYAEVMAVHGTMFGAQELTFTVQVNTIDGQPIAQADVTTGRGDWQVELPHTYSGEPVEAVLRVIPIGVSQGIYTSVPLVVAGLSHRPEGVFGSLTRPTEGEVVGGDSIPVEGKASGVFEGTINLALVTPEGGIISEQIVTVMNPYYVDEVPWRSELATNGHIGLARVWMYIISANDGSFTTLGEVNVIIEVSAG